VIKGHFVGTGDVFTALLLVWLEETGGDLIAPHLEVECEKLENRNQCG